MTRDEFMKELAYLLQDIQDEDKEDALQYYMDYFDEAGPDREADVVRELGSPERIASIIRSDIAGNLKDGGEFTESGYKDERFRDPNYQVVKRFDLPEGREPKWQESRRDDRERQDGRQENVHGAQGSRDSWQENVHGAQGSQDSWQENVHDAQGNHGRPRPRTSGPLKVILWIILIIVAAPVLLGIGGGALGIVGGLLGILVGALVFIGVLTIAMLISGVAMVPYGIVHIFMHPLNGFLISGTGLIFLGVGAMTDFGPLIANPISFLMGAAAQVGIYSAYFFAILLGFNGKEAAAISIIGGADGPTSLFLCSKLGQSQIMGPIAVAAYSYMALVPIIQPPVMKLLTTEKERKIKMEQLRPVSKLEKILFPIIVTIVVCLILPSTAPLVGMLMLGNLFRECGVVKQLAETASNALMYIVVILLGTSVGATTSAEAFLNWTTLKIVGLGLVAFIFGTAGGVLLGKLLCKITGGKINPLIGSAGVSAVPMAARVSQKVGAEADPTNFLLMHAMGPNVAGVIGTAVAAGTFMAIFGV